MRRIVAIIALVAFAFSAYAQSFPSPTFSNVNIQGTLTVDSSILSIGGNFTTSANPLVLTTTGSTNITLPSTGTLATTANLGASLPSAASTQLYVGTGNAGSAAVASVGSGLAWVGSTLTATASGGGTVSGGTANQLGYYSASGTTISGLASANNGILITSGSGAPSIGNTLPSAVQSNITTLGTVNSGVWNGTLVGPTYGGTGVNNGSATITLGGSLTTTGVATPTLAFGATGHTYNFPNSAGTLAELGFAQTWGAAQTFPTSDLVLGGSSTGVTAFASANAGASNFTLTFPATTDTVATIAATQTLTNKSIAASEVNSGTLAAAQMFPLASGDVYLGNGSSQPAASTITAALDSAFGTTQGSLLYRGASAWTALAPGTSGWFLETLGPSANPAWASVAGGGSGCTVSGGAQFQILVNNGSSGCSSSPNASVNLGALTLGTSGTAGSVTMGNATSGTVILAPVSGALGTVTASLPANTGTLAELNLSQTWTAAQTFPTAGVLLTGSSTGVTTFNSANSGVSNFTLTVPANSGTLAEINLAQTWTTTQTFNNSTIKMIGSSTGQTTFSNANASATNYTLTFPAATDTVAVLGTAQTWTAAQTFTNSDLKLLGSSTGVTTLTSANAGATNYTLTVPAVTDTVATLAATGQTQAGGVHLTSHGYSTGSVTVDCGLNPAQYVANNGAFTLTAPSNDGSCQILVRNTGSAGAVTFSGFTVGSNTGAALDTTSGHLFTITVWRITDATGPVAAYSIFAHQ